MSTLDETGLLSFPTDEETVRKNDMAHVLPLVVRPGRSSTPCPSPAARAPTSGTTTGTRYLDFSSQLVNVNIGHQHPRLVAAIQEQAGRLCSVSPAFANDARGEAARLIAELAPGDLDMVFFTNGGAEANENAIRMARAAHRPAQDARRVPQLPRRDRRRDRAHRRPAPLGDRARHARRRPLLGAVPLPLAVPRRAPRRRSATARSRTCATRIMVEGPHTVAAIILETVVGTNGILVPPDGYLAGRARDLRRVRHRLHRRRGDGRLRPVRRVVRGRPLGRHARPHQLREGRQLRLRAARRRRSSRDAIADTFADRRRSPAASPTPAIRSPARRRSRVDPDLRGRGHPRARAPARRRRHRPRAARARRRGIRRVGEVRGLGVFWALELVRDRDDPRAARAVQRLGRGRRADGRVRGRAARPRACGRSSHFNRTHVVPPCTISEDEVDEGVAVARRGARRRRPPHDLPRHPPPGPDAARQG